MKPFRLTVSSPDGNLFQGEVVKLDARGTEGEFAIMAGHIPFVTSVVQAPCVLWLDEETKKEARCDGGVLSVDENSATLIAGSFQFI